MVETKMQASRKQVATKAVTGTDFTAFSDDLFDAIMTKKGRKYLYGTISMKNSSDCYLNFRLILKKNTVISQHPSQCKLVMDIDHVFVPIKLRGLSKGDVLARKAFSIAVCEGWVVRPTCSYVRDTFLARNTEFKGHIEVGIEVEVNKAIVVDANESQLVANKRKRKVDAVASSMG